MELLRIENLHKSYKHNQVLKGLNMTVSKGEVYGFIGKNGSGKTTTMNIVTGLLSYDQGSVQLIGENGKKPTIGYLPESPSFFTYMNADEYLSYIAACSKYRGDVKRRNDELLTLTSLKEAARRRIKGYSRGMLQRLGLAAAIYSDPDLVLLDEPTSALDPQGRADVIEIIKRLKSAGKTVILSTHILTDIERVADRLGILKNGQIVVESTLSDLYARYRKSRLFMVPVNINPEKEQALLNFGMKKAENGYELELNGDNNQWKELLNLCVNNDIEIDKYQHLTSTLEEIYMEVIGKC